MLMVAMFQPILGKKVFRLDQTFSIELKDLSKLLLEHQSVKNRLTEGGLIYIDSSYLFKRPKICSFI